MGAAPEVGGKRWSWTWFVIRILLIIVILAVVIDVVSGLRESDQLAIDAAKAACRERGLNLDDMNSLSAKISSSLLGRTAEVEFKGRRQNKPSIIQVTLQKSFSFLDWQTTEVHEKAE